MKDFETIRKPSKKNEKKEEGMKKVPKKKSYNGPKRIRGSFRVLRDEELDNELILDL